MAPFKLFLVSGVSPGASTFAENAENVVQVERDAEGLYQAFVVNGASAFGALEAELVEEELSVVLELAAVLLQAQEKLGHFLDPLNVSQRHARHVPFDIADELLAIADDPREALGHRLGQAQVDQNGLDVLDLHARVQRAVVPEPVEHARGDGQHLVRERGALVGVRVDDLALAVAVDFADLVGVAHRHQHQVLRQRVVWVRSTWVVPQQELPLVHEQVQVRLQRRRVELVEEQPHRLVRVLLGGADALVDEVPELGRADAEVHGLESQLGHVLEQDAHQELDEVGLAAAGLAHDHDGHLVPGLLQNEQDLGVVVHVQLVALAIVEAAHEPDNLLSSALDVPRVRQHQPRLFGEGLGHLDQLVHVVLDRLLRVVPHSHGLVPVLVALELQPVLLEPLLGLFLDQAEQIRLDGLWVAHERHEAVSAGENVVVVARVPLGHFHLRLARPAVKSGPNPVYLSWTE